MSFLKKLLIIIISLSQMCLSTKELFPIAIDTINESNPFTVLLGNGNNLVGWLDESNFELKASLLDVDLQHLSAPNLLTAAYPIDQTNIQRAVSKLTADGKSALIYLSTTGAIFKTFSTSLEEVTAQTYSDILSTNKQYNLIYLDSIALILTYTKGNFIIYRMIDANNNIIEQENYLDSDSIDTSKIRQNAFIIEDGIQNFLATWIVYVLNTVTVKFSNCRPFDLECDELTLYTFSVNGSSELDLYTTCMAVKTLSDNTRRYLIVFVEDASYGKKITFMMYNENSSFAYKGATEVNTSQSGIHKQPTVKLMNSGYFLVCWTFIDNSVSSIHCRYIDQEGDFVENEFSESDAGSRYPFILIDSNNFYIGWELTMPNNDININGNINSLSCSNFVKSATTNIALTGIFNSEAFYASNLSVSFDSLPTVGNFQDITNANTNILSNTFYPINNLRYFATNPGNAVSQFKIKDLSSTTATSCSITINVIAATCYLSCQTCSELGNVSDHKCTTCVQDYYPFNTSFCYDAANPPAGFFLNTSNTFSACHPNCSTCNTGGSQINNQCLTCVPGKYPNFGTSAPYNCNSPSDGTFLDTGFLKSCYTSCATCSQTGDINNNNCNTCKASYYHIKDAVAPYNCNLATDSVTGYYFNSNNNLFEQCYTKCQTCSQLGDSINNFCTTCKSGSVFKVDELYNCYVMTDRLNDYFYNSISNQFERCYSSCKTCNEQGSVSDHKCLTCKDSFYFILNSVAPSNCFTGPLDGYYLDTSVYKPCYNRCGQCTRAGDAINNYCTVCAGNYLKLPDANSPFQCYVYTEEVPGYYYDINTQSFQKCDVSCSTCYAAGKNYCNTCSQGYGKIFTDSNGCYSTDLQLAYYFDQANDGYEPCYFSCGSCSKAGDIQSHNCLTCREHFFKIEGGIDGNCYDKDIEIQKKYFDTNIFRSCGLPCNYCTGSFNDSIHNCKSCAADYYTLVDDKTKCYNKTTIVDNHYFNNIDLIFDTCMQGCLSCDNKSKCKGCQDKYFLMDNECVLICPIGYFGSNRVCTKCAENCSSCSSLNICTKCIDGYGLKDNKCVKSCSAGYYFDNSQQDCLSCKTDCLECENLNKCLQCKDGFTLSVDSCILKVIDTNSQEFNQNTQIANIKIEDIQNTIKTNDIDVSPQNPGLLLKSQEKIFNSISTALDDLEKMKNINYNKVFDIISIGFNISDNLNKKSNDTVVNKNTDEFVETMKERVNNFADKYFSENASSNQTLLYTNENFKVQFYNYQPDNETLLQERIQKNMTIVDIGGCESKIKEAIGSTKPLPSAQIDFTTPLTSKANMTDSDDSALVGNQTSLSSNSASYNVYSNTGKKLDYSELCPQDKIDYSFPPGGNYLNRSHYDEFKEGLAVDIYNKTDRFYVSRCFSWGKNSTQSDVPIGFRRQEVSNNTIDCGVGCEYKGLDKYNYTKCECSTNTKQVQKQVAKVSGLVKSNFDLILCFSEYINNNEITKINAGLYLYCGIMLLICIAAIFQLGCPTHIQKYKSIIARYEADFTHGKYKKKKKEDPKKDEQKENNNKVEQLNDKEASKDNDSQEKESYDEPNEEYPKPVIVNIESDAKMNEKPEETEYNQNNEKPAQYAEETDLNKDVLNVNDITLNDIEIPKNVNENDMNQIIEYVKKGQYITQGVAASLNVDLLITHDKRSFSRYIKDIFYTKHVFMKTFISYSIFNPRFITTMQFFFAFSMNFFANAVVYEDKLIYERKDVEDNVTIFNLVQFY